MDAVLDRRAIEIDTIFDGIIHCIYAKFNVELMYDSEVMNQKVSTFWIFWLIFCTPHSSISSPKAILKTNVAIAICLNPLLNATKNAAITISCKSSWKVVLRSSLKALADIRPKVSPKLVNAVLARSVFAIPFWNNSTVFSITSAKFCSSVLVEILLNFCWISNLKFWKETRKMHFQKWLH